MEYRKTAWPPILISFFLLLRRNAFTVCCDLISPIICDRTATHHACGHLPVKVQYVLLVLHYVKRLHKYVQKCPWKNKPTSQVATSLLGSKVLDISGNIRRRYKQMYSIHVFEKKK